LDCEERESELLEQLFIGPGAHTPEFSETSGDVAEFGVKLPMDDSKVPVLGHGVDDGRSPP
jgi:hypothetical protein